MRTECIDGFTSIHADEGKYVTQKVLDSEYERIFTDVVFAAIGHEDDWMEVDVKYKIEHDAMITKLKEKGSEEIEDVNVFAYIDELKNR